MHREMVNGDNGYARPEQLSALKTIWLRSFPADTPEDVDAFFQSLFRPEDCLVHWENDQPVSMAFALPVVFHAADELYPAQYIYAASTLPEWRGKGIFGELLRFAFEQGAAQGMAASFLRPGEASLFGYYKRFGYRPFFSSEEIRLSRPVDRKWEGKPLQVLAPEAYAAARGRALAHIPFHVEWSADQAAYAVRNAAAAGGCALAGPQSCALCEPDGQVLRVRELICPPEEEAAYFHVFSSFACTEWEIRRPGKGEFYGMWKPLSSAGEMLLDRAVQPYMGLSLE